MNRLSFIRRALAAIGATTAVPAVLAAPVVAENFPCKHQAPKTKPDNNARMRSYMKMQGYPADYVENMFPTGAKR